MKPGPPRSSTPFLVKILDGITDGDECIEWKKGKSPKGYARFWDQHKQRPEQVSRALMEIMLGPIPRGVLVCHHCDNPACIRPSHLFLGTAADNTNDMVKKDRMYNTQLTVDMVREIRKRHKDEGLSATELARQYPVSLSGMGKILRNDTWKNVTSY